MISRRNIRVKVMQTIYTLSTLEQAVKPGEPVKLLQRHFDQSKDLLLYIGFFLTETAGYAERDAFVRSSKHLPTEEDLHVNTKIAGNELLWKIKEDSSFQSEISRLKPDLMIDRELVRKIYVQLIDSALYKAYIQSNERKSKEEKEILEYLLNELMLHDEVFISHLEENFMNWDDDSDMVVQVLRNLLQKPGSVDFKEVISPDKWEFAKSLLHTV
ncbi:MAG: transcription antitermination factor NusB, partial [Flavisolibacter sp.]